MYDEFPFWSAPFGTKLLDMINYRRGITALDIGFGTGFPLVELAMRLGPTCTVRGIDPSTDVIPLVEKTIRRFPAFDRRRSEKLVIHLGNIHLGSCNA